MNQDRILSWGLQTDPTCLLCSTEPESRNHLLFNCCFSLSIWTALSRRCSLQALPDWDQTILQLTSLRTGKLHRRLPGKQRPMRSGHNATLVFTAQSSAQLTPLQKTSSLKSQTGSPPSDHLIQQ
ncbi:hypothetical protein HID58_070162 [Brassica napus]|uniref:Reverse transcriptase zinc-binding domain-containing protein n=1 Tax=Brassica napus TaxID=3708 RepID=A0ABQ7YY01_BRANA|nr:hypothetical protein HID58_070162 [Brassica napus]